MIWIVARFGAAPRRECMHMREGKEERGLVAELAEREFEVGI